MPIAGDLAQPAQRRQRAVVPAATVAEPVPGPIDRQQRRQHEPGYHLGGARPAAGGCRSAAGSSASAGSQRRNSRTSRSPPSPARRRPFPARRGGPAAGGRRFRWRSASSRRPPSPASSAVRRAAAETWCTTASAASGPSFWSATRRRARIRLRSAALASTMDGCAIGPDIFRTYLRRASRHGRRWRGIAVGRRHKSRWSRDPLWPACAGGRHVPDPRARQGQLP